MTAKKKGLGRGLEVLLGLDETAPEARLGQTQRSVFGRIRDALR